MSGLFGTDSARGLIVAELSCELAMQAGRATTELFAGEQGGKIIVAKDNALSSAVLEAAVCAGICSSGADAETVGELSGAAASFIVKKHNAAAGIMISEATGITGASGITVFGSDGFRLSEEMQLFIEERIYPVSEERRRFENIGRMLSCNTAAEEYFSHLKEITETSLENIKVAIVCKNSFIEKNIKELLSEMGADVTIIQDNTSLSEIEDTPDIAPVITGFECLMDMVEAGDFHCGLAFAGDGSSFQAVDENGMPVDGDTLLAIIAGYLRQKELLKDNTIVVNVMSSLGLLNFAEKNDINVVTSGSCGRSVLDRMREGEYNLGGGQSGHIFLTDYSPCDDGLLCALKLLEILASTRKKLSELAGEMKKLPQISLNVRISDKGREVWKNDEKITGLIEHYEEELGSEGRIIVRESSGNAPFIRVMIEGCDFGRINDIAVDIAQCIKDRCRFYN
ncbi:MAG: phosphoglucosamine mutase [Ruminococcus sp.]|nr:phosphoglucosamine mutase [Ruminococcus sp.]